MVHPLQLIGVVRWLTDFNHLWERSRDGRRSDRGRGAQEAVRRRGRPRRHRLLRSLRGRSSASSVPTVPGRPPPCGSSRPSSNPMRAGRRSSGTTSAETGRRPSPDRPRRPVRRGRRQPDRAGEPAADRTAHPDGASEIMPRPRSCSIGSTSAMPPTGPPAPTREGCAGDWTSPPRWCRGHRSCSSTSPRRDSTLKPQRALGHDQRARRARARPSC